MISDHFEAEDVRAACERLTASRVFGRAERSKRFLRYVVEQVLAGQADAIKEYAIAVEVFDRARYDPKVDSVVRVEASKLRSLLEKYYETEGAADPIRVEIPKGAYVPRFSACPSSVTVGVQGGDGGELPSPAGTVVAIGGNGDRPEAVGTVPLGAPSTEAAARSGAGQKASVAMTLATLLVAVTVAGWAWLGRATGTGATGQPMVAVLPFTDLSPAPGFEHVAGGLAQEISAALAATRAAQVPSRTSMARFRGLERDASQMVKELGVHAVVEGTVRVQGTQVRVDVALVDARTGLRLWGQAYDRPLGDVLGVQREISEAVAQAFNLLSDTRRALVRPHSANLIAYQHYLHAVQLLGGDSAGDLSAAIDLFRAATLADPAYALAWASLSSTLSLRAEWGFVRPVDVAGEAEAAARRAVALNGSLAEAHQALGLVQGALRLDPRGAAPAFERAIELDPSSASLRHDYARFVLLPLGRADEAEAQLRRALAVDPQNLSLLQQLSSAQLARGRLDGAEQTLAAAFALAGHESPALQVQFGRLALARGDVARALRHWETAAGIIRSSWVLGYLGWGLSRVGRIDEARAVLAELRGGRFAEPDSAIAAIHAALGEHDEALAALARARAVRASGTRMLAIDPRYEALREDPRFQALATGPPVE